MILSKSRFFLCVTFFIALLNAPLSHAQTSPTSAPPADHAEPDATLPNSPSFSTSQEQQSAKPTDETPQQRKARERAEADRQIAQQEKQRIGGIMPNFNVNMGGAFVPLTPAQKWSLSWHTIVDPYTIALAFVVGGGLGEIEDDHQGYSWGPAGYFRRTGASYLDNVNGNLIGNFLLPVALHQDPRYFRKGKGSVPSRVIYSALTTFICKGDNGKKQFNISNVAGNFISGGISNVYYPPDERGALLTVENGITVTLEGMLGAQLFEFSPDFSSYLQRRRDRKQLEMQQKIDAAAAAKMLNPPATPKP